MKLLPTVFLHVESITNKVLSLCRVIRKLTKLTPRTLKRRTAVV